MERRIDLGLDASFLLHVPRSYEDVAKRVQLPGLDGLAGALAGAGVGHLLLGAPGGRDPLQLGLILTGQRQVIQTCPERAEYVAFWRSLCRAQDGDESAPDGEHKPVDLLLYHRETQCVDVEMPGAIQFRDAQGEVSEPWCLDADAHMTSYTHDGLMLHALPYQISAACNTTLVTLVPISCTNRTILPHWGKVLTGEP